MIEIEILDTGKRLPLTKKERLRMTFQAADFGEAGSGSGSFSTTCSVPITPQVIEALGFSIVPNATSILSAYKNIKARILQDENEIDKGFIRIDEENTTKKELKITFYGRNVDWFTALGERTLRDLDLSEYDHFKTPQAINEVRSQGYVYLPVDYGTLQAKSSATILEDEIWPAVFVSTLVKQMFKEAGFKVDGTLFDKPEFNRLLIPFSQEEVNMTFAKQANLSTVVTKKNSLVDGEEITLPSYDPDLEIKLELDARFPYSAPFRNLNNNSIRDSVYRPYRPQQTPLTIKDDTDTFNTTTSTYTATARMYVDVYISVQGIKLFLGGAGGQNDLFTYEVILKKNGSLIGIEIIQQYGDGSLSREASFPNILLEIGDTLEVYFKIKTSYTSGYYGFGYGNDYSPYFIVMPKLATLTGFKFPLGTFMPEMAQSKLMEYLFFIYGLVPSFDKATNTVILDSLTDLTVNSAENWTGKLDTSQSIERRYFDFVEDYAKQNNCTYAELEDDTEIQTYANNYLSGYGSGAITIDNDYLDATQDYFEAPFFPTKQRKVFTGISNLNFQLPYIFKTDSDEGRIVLFAGYRSVSELSNTGISTVTIAGEARSTIPYSYFIPPLNIQINDPINLVNLGFNNPLDEFEASLPILQRTYYNLQKVLNKPISITCSLKLTAYDISRLKFNRLKYIQELGGYFYLNKISQYDGSGEPTECELIKWY